MEKEELKKIFVEFLIKEGCLFSYYENCKTSFDELYEHANEYRMIKTIPINFLILSFNFKDTKQGNNYWWKMHHKWKRYFNERNNKLKMKKWTVRLKT